MDIFYVYLDVEQEMGKVVMYSHFKQCIVLGNKKVNTNDVTFFYSTIVTMI